MTLDITKWTSLRLKFENKPRTNQPWIDWWQDELYCGLESARTIPLIYHWFLSATCLYFTFLIIFSWSSCILELCCNFSSLFIQPLLSIYSTTSPDWLNGRIWRTSSGLVCFLGCKGRRPVRALSWTVPGLPALAGCSLVGDIIMFWLQPMGNAGGCARKVNKMDGDRKSKGSAEKARIKKG